MRFLPDCCNIEEDMIPRDKVTSVKAESPGSQIPSRADLYGDGYKPVLHAEPRVVSLRSIGKLGGSSDLGEVHPYRKEGANEL